MTDPHLIEAVVQAVLAQLGREVEPPCACHAAPRGCCPDGDPAGLGSGVLPAAGLQGRTGPGVPAGAGVGSGRGVGG